MSHPTAGPVENAISADVSNAVMRLLLERADQAGTLIGAAAVMTGAMDGLARYTCSIQLTDATADELADSIDFGVRQLVRRHHNPPTGAA